MKHAPQLPTQSRDIQALLGSGFGWLTGSRFWLLTIEDVSLAQQWLGTLIESGLVKSVGELGAFRETIKEQVSEIAAIAFSFEGLMALGLEESDEFPFPTPFRAGMGSALRKTLMREDGGQEEWLWTDHGGGTEPRRPAVHLLVATWWNPSATRRMPEPSSPAFTVTRVEGCPSFFSGGHWHEPFRFRDGLSQPEIHGLKDTLDEEPTRTSDETRKEMARDHVVAPGEFILGYRNEYNELSYCSDVKRWKAGGTHAHPGARFTLNGSYLAVQQIEQHVDALDELEEREKNSSAAATGCPMATTTTTVERMMGRRRNGAPLGWTSSCAPSQEEANAFRYRVDDENGFVTPRGAHIRRANPRDMLGHDVASGIMSSKLHRLLRRGRPYRSEEDPSTVGLFFMACNTDIERQFEFIHQRWLRNPRFADLDNEDDPIVGVRPASGEAKSFSVPALPVGKAVSFRALTTTRGGGYFFLPGLKALSFIAGLSLDQEY